ncbi:mannonate dehydratase [Klebsiella pneumoniae]|nr:mannonate dehydratase [Klebsiella pneumoniae]
MAVSVSWAIRYRLMMYGRQEATGVVTTLHHITKRSGMAGVDEIKARQALLTAKGLTWSVVESIPVPEDVETHSRAVCDLDCQLSAEHPQPHGMRHRYRAFGNFMPILEAGRAPIWNMSLPDGSRAAAFRSDRFRRL